MNDVNDMVLCFTVFFFVVNDGYYVYKVTIFVVDQILIYLDQAHYFDILPVYPFL